MSNRLATDNEVLAMVLYAGMHFERTLADEAARRVGAIWGRRVDVVELDAPGLGATVFALYDSTPDAPPVAAP